MTRPQGHPAVGDTDHNGSADGLAEGTSAAVGYAGLMDVMPDFFAVVAQPGYQMERLNVAGKVLLGIPESENITERSLMEFIPGQCLWTLLNDAVPTAWRSGAWSGNLGLRKLDGTECFAAVSIIARAASATESQDRLWITARDISEMQATIVALKHDQWYLRALLENAPDSIYFKDLSSRFLRVSHSMSTCFGLTDPKQVEGKQDFDFFTREHAQSAYEGEQTVIQTERAIIDTEQKETWADGRVTWASTTKLPLYNEYGQVIGTFGISRDITGRKHTEQALAQSQRNLLDASRLAGMAEVASGVLHNIGNAFNSVNTSTGLVADHARTLKFPGLARAVALLQENIGHLDDFLTNDARGKQLPGYLIQLSAQLTNGHQTLTKEIQSLSKSVDHIKNIIAMQQSYARVSSFLEELPISELVSEALQISEVSLDRHRVTVVRDFQDEPRVIASRHKVLEILVNLIGNAKQAVDENGKDEKRITISVRSNASTAQIGVQDNGVGIPAENLPRIFSFGFTTKTNGHGFGLHSSAIAAQEMHGSLNAKSEGRGHGAEFVLELPVAKLPKSP